MFARLPRRPNLPRLGGVSPRVRSAARTLASSTAGILFGAALVGLAALRLAPEPAVTGVAENATPLVVPAGAAIPTVVVATPAAAPTPEPTAAPTPAATAAPEPPPAPAPAIEAVPIRMAGRAYAALTVPAGQTLETPVGGRVEIRLYQWIDGQIRTGANVASLPYYPYVIVRGADRVLTLRPGALGVDAELLVRDGASVGPATPLVRIIGAGASSWRTFYDRSLAAQVVASLTTGAGTDLDATALFRH